VRYLGSAIVPLSLLGFVFQLSGCANHLGAAAPQSAIAEKTGNGPYTLLKPVYQVPPVYPPTAFYDSVQGKVLVCFTVRKDGSVADAHIVRTSFYPKKDLKALGTAALGAIRQWKFSPERINGHVVGTPHACQVITFGIRP